MRKTLFQVVNLLRPGVVNLLRRKVVSFYRLRVVNFTGFSNIYQDDYNIIIAPMSNKISTLGVAYAALKNPNIQICYASTNQYNIDEKHSETDYVYYFDLFDYIN